MTKIAIVDIETTGPRIDEGDQIIQLAAVIIEDGLIIHEYSMFINPERDIPVHISQLTGIEVSTVAKAPTFEKVAGLWYERLHDCVFVAHNLALDLTFLTEYFNIYGYDNFNPIALDTVKLAKILVPQAQGFNLNDLSEYFDLPFANAHDALADAQLTTQLLHHLALKAKMLDNVTLERILPFVEALPNDEAELIKHPDYYILKEEVVVKAEEKIANVSESVIKQSNKHQQLAQLIIEKAHQEKLLVVEDNVAPINPTVIKRLVEEIIDQGQAFCFAIGQSSNLTDWRRIILNYISVEKLVVLKNARHFIHIAAFEELLKTYQIEHANQQELLVIAATINWLTQTNLGDFAEINQELNIQPILVKRCGRYLSKKTHKFYQQMIKNSYTAQIVLLDHRFLTELTRYHRDISDSFFDRWLIVDNLSKYTNAVRQTYQDELAVSEWFTETRLLADHLSYREEVPQHASYFIKQLNLMTKLLNDLSNYCQYLLEDEQKIQATSSKIEHYISMKDTASFYFLDSIVEIYHLHSKLAKALKTDITLINIINDIDKKWYYQFNLLEKTLYQMIMSKHPQNYWVLSAESIQGQFFHVKIINQALIIDDSHVNYLERFNQVILFSPGDYHHLQKNGSYQWLQLSNFKYFLLPKQTSNVSLTINVPIEYILDKEVETEKSEFGQLQKIYIEDNLDSYKDYLLILVNSKTAAQKAYRMLSQSELIRSRYSLHAQGVSGSLKKIKRRAKEMQPSIIIMSWNALLNEQWCLENEDFEIFMTSLPFNSPKKASIQAMMEYLTEDIEAGFHEILLPQMIQNFKFIVSYLENNFQLNTINLFDERIFTKYYSQQVREQLEDLVKFEICP